MCVHLADHQGNAQKCDDPEPVAGDGQDVHMSDAERGSDDCPHT